jgi:hypothetical protein
MISETIGSDFMISETISDSSGSVSVVSVSDSSGSVSVVLGVALVGVSETFFDPSGFVMVVAALPPITFA